MPAKNLASPKSVHSRWHNGDKVQYVSTLLCLSLLLTWFCNLSIAQYRVEDYYQPSYEEDWGKAFNQCFHEMDKAGHGTLILDGTKNYTFYSVDGIKINV